MNDLKKLVNEVKRKGTAASAQILRALSAPPSPPRATVVPEERLNVGEEDGFVVYGTNSTEPPTFHSLNVSCTQYSQPREERIPPPLYQSLVITYL